MIPGSKLLLADDSAAIRKVIDLTFTDEGMQVTTVGDGQDALEELNQSKPDVVLADIYMPGIDGYELCKFIKQSERFRGVPVMLLVGSFEPFDEAEAKRAGADDVVTKPFQSIRDLVSRVGSLVSHKDVAPSDDAQNASVPGINQSQAEAVAGEESEVTAAASDEISPAHEAETAEPSTNVFVEAPAMETVEATVAQEHTCPADIELQTADTRELEPITEFSTVEAEAEFCDTIEVEVVQEFESAEPAADDLSQDGGPVIESQPVEAVSGFDEDGVLDLGNIDSFASAIVEGDFELEIDVAPVEFSRHATTVAESSRDSAETDAQRSGESPGAQVEETHNWTPVSSSQPPTAELESAVDEQSSSQVGAGELSPAAIEAISRRVVEQLSDKVVREIAWEVVPELSELLIKKRLERRE
ncbi:MAG TPA: response regulator [Pyrinomonadaceae bacterium]|nr:response regulator [Pyrinomonadaceae bacterium]